MSIRVCVIGAGAGGLNALRHLTAKPHIFKAVAYEQTSVIGGTWVYTDKTGTDENGFPIHSSMYRNMKTNLPKEIMGFPDYPFPKEGPSYIGHNEVLCYLENYAEHYQLKKCIQFNTIVEKVSRVNSDKPERTRWNVKVSHLKHGTTEECNFDAIIVCNGHYSIPLVPDIKGLETFKGKWLHSHNYRYPEHFREQAVLCLGAGPSGTDISLDLEPYAKQVYLSHRKPRLSTPLPAKVKQVSGISSIDGTTIVLTDDTKLEVDVIIFCTGYHYTFPFLDTDCNLTVDENEIITPVYEQLVHTQFPTMSFVGLPKLITPFPLFDCQVRFVLAYLSGDIQLPSNTEMERDTQDRFENMLKEGIPKRFGHKLGTLQWDYNDRLCNLAGLELIPRFIEKLYEASHIARSSNLPTYKCKNYRTINENEFIEVDESFKPL